MIKYFIKDDTTFAVMPDGWSIELKIKDTLTSITTAFNPTLNDWLKKEADPISEFHFQTLNNKTFDRVVEVMNRFAIIEGL